MRRDMGIVRDILLQVDEFGCFPKDLADGWDYHIKIMSSSTNFEGLIATWCPVPVTSMRIFEVEYYLTWQGYDLLAYIHDDAVWAKAGELAKNNGLNIRHMATPLVTEFCSHAQIALHREASHGDDEPTTSFPPGTFTSDDEPTVIEAIAKPSINLNASVWVRLTDTARILLDRPELSADEQPLWEEWQLWDLMSKIGEVITTPGLGKVYFIDNEIRLVNPNL